MLVVAGLDDEVESLVLSHDVDELLDIETEFAVEVHLVCVIETVELEVVGLCVFQ